MKLTTSMTMCEFSKKKISIDFNLQKAHLHSLVRSQFHGLFYLDEDPLRFHSTAVQLCKNVAAMQSSASNEPKNEREIISKSKIRKSLLQAIIRTPLQRKRSNVPFGGHVSSSRQKHFLILISSLRSSS